MMEGHDAPVARRGSFDWGESSPPTARMGDYGASATAGPTVSRLRRGMRVGRGRHAGADDDEEKAIRGKLGMVEGVFFRVLTNLFGVILFLRLGWLVAYAGIWLGIFIVFLCSSLTLITALSLSAICTNGKVAAGGAYYLISRALGPEFGASIGVLFYVATSVSVSLYLLGFAETVVNIADGEIIDEKYDLQIIAFFALILCQLICLVGVSYVVKVEKFMLFILLAAVLLFTIGAFQGPSEGGAYIGQIPMTAGINLRPDFAGASTPQPESLTYLYELGLVTGGPEDGLKSASQCRFQSADKLRDTNGNVNMGIALAVFFPAVTGILAGANVSGDLRDPSSAIPTGTVAAIIVGAIIYAVLVVIFGVSFHRTTILRAELVFNDTGNLHYACTYGGLFHDTALVAESSMSRIFVYFGIFAASLSSGLAALLGAPRILQALARDRLFSTFDPLAKGYGKNDEPLRAYGVTFVLSALCILPGDINSVAPLITTFFLSSYAMVNYACFAAEESQSPGWRPTFKFFSKWLALVGALGCVSVMLFLSAITGFITFTIGLALFKYVEVSTREGLGGASNWGPHKEAADYATALKSALLLEEQTLRVRSEPAFESFEHPHKGLAMNGGRKPLRTSSATSEDLSLGAVTHTEIELGGIASSNSRPGAAPRLEFDEDEDRYEHGFGHDEPEGRGRGPSLGRTTIEQNAPQFDTTHVKNYRPQCLVLSGPPRTRPALAVLIAGFRKARGITVFGDVIIGDLSDPELLRIRNERASISYVAKYGIKAFNDVIIAPSFRDGCRSLLQISGLGRRMRVNTVVLGFLDDWHIPPSQRYRQHDNVAEAADLESGGEMGVEDDISPPPTVADYVGVIGDAFDLGLGVVILRGEMDLLRSEYLTQTIRTEMDRVLSLGLSGEVARQQHGPYRSPTAMVGDEEVAPQSHTMMGQQHSPGPVGGARESLADLAIDRKSARRIDVWWLVDDGGLTLMLPHILRQAKTPPWIGCSLRVMAIGATDEEAMREEANMTKLLNKLRITASVKVVSLAQVRRAPNNANGATAGAGDAMETVSLSDGGNSTLQKQLSRAYSSLDDQNQNHSRRSTYSKVGALIAEHSSDALLVAVSLPVPPMTLEPEEYLEWLDLLSKDCAPPVLMVRGSQRDVVTIFS